MEYFLTPKSLEEAEAWLLQTPGAPVELIEQLFGGYPEASSGERRMTLRLPEVTARRLERLAADRGLSMAALFLRCAEHCIAEPTHLG